MAGFTQPSFPGGCPSTFTNHPCDTSAMASLTTARRQEGFHMGNDERLYSEVAKDRPLGDTPRTEEHGGPRLVDTRDAIQFESGSIAGDTPRTDPKPALVQNHDLRFPNAGELRKSGAKVPSKYKDSEVPGEYPLDTPRTDPEPALVRDYPP